jgi:hypothetical protein
LKGLKGALWVIGARHDEDKAIGRLDLDIVGESGGGLLEASETALAECRIVGGDLRISKGEIS